LFYDSTCQDILPNSQKVNGHQQVRIFSQQGPTTIHVIQKAWVDSIDSDQKTEETEIWKRPHISAIGQIQPARQAESSRTGNEERQHDNNTIERSDFLYHPFASWSTAEKKAARSVSTNRSGLGGFQDIARATTKNGLRLIRLFISLTWLTHTATLRTALEDNAIGISRLPFDLT
jgi:hypothetical protein